MKARAPEQPVCLQWRAFLSLFTLLSSLFYVRADATDAVVRMPSHGASATVIHSDDRRTFLLSCAHAFQGNDRRKPIKLDGSSLPEGQAQVLAVDYDLDLSLVMIPAGGAANVAPAAGPGYRPGRNLVSVGYDEMRVPATRKPAHIINVDSDITWTREPPWHGRSGGALLDLESGQLIGVVSAYVHYPQGPGLYVSHRAICAFLEGKGWASPSGSIRSIPSIPMQSMPTRPWPDPRPPMLPGMPGCPG